MEYFAPLHSSQVLNIYLKPYNKFHFQSKFSRIWKYIYILQLYPYLGQSVNCLDFFSLNRTCILMHRIMAQITQIFYSNNIVQLRFVEINYDSANLYECMFNIFFLHGKFTYMLRIKCVFKIYDYFHQLVTSKGSVQAGAQQVLYYYLYV